MMQHLRKPTAVVVGVFFAILVAAGTALAAGSGGLWIMAGHDLQNTRYQDNETKIKVSNVTNLAVQWQFTTGGDVSATAAVDGSNVYFPDWAGNLFALDRKTGAKKWQHKVSDYTGVAGDFARTTPVVAGNMLIFGDQGGKLGAGATVMAVNKNTGALIWKTQVEPFQFAVVTQSAVVDANSATGVTQVYVGVSSVEEGVATNPAYPCCSFRGSMQALNAATGQILWKTYMVPQGYSGGAVWGSTPVVDHKRNSVYITTGNNYTLPPEVQQCVANAIGSGTAVQACLSPDDHFDSVLALDPTTGAIKWATNAMPFDAWTVACLPGFDPTNCPQPAGPDYDFGQGPALFTVTSGGKKVDLLGAGQKSGDYWAFNPATGAVVWRTQVGPGGVTGGLEWGSSTDGSHIFAADTNASATPWTLVQNGQATGPTVTSGFWSALDAATGKILWQTPDPAGGTTQDAGFVSGANGVVYACSTDPVGHMYALNAANGQVLWSFASGGACESGAAISNGVVFWGSGYSQFFTGNNKFYAFTLP